MTPARVAAAARRTRLARQDIPMQLGRIRWSLGALQKYLESLVNISQF
jgi:hypothetical protein